MTGARFLVLLRALLLAVLLAAAPAVAQQGDGAGNVIPPEWTALSERATAALATGTASDEALNSLRAELVDWRSRFQEAQQVNAGRIQTLRAELDTLGPAPAEGEPAEPPEIAQRRADINAQLETLLAPVRTANSAFTSADGLIRETDALIETRRAAALLSQEETPLNPVLWWPAATAASAWALELGAQLIEPFQTATSRALIEARGVQVGVLFFIGILLFLRSGRWVGRLRERLVPYEGDHPLARLGLLVVSIARLVLPLVGLSILARVPLVAGAEGVLVDRLPVLLPLMGLSVLGARWLALQAFPAREDAVALFPVTPARRPEARFHAMTLGVVVAAAQALDVMVQTSAAVQATRGVPGLVLAVIAGVTLLRLGQLLLTEGRAARAEAAEGEINFWAQVMRLVGRWLMLVGALAPLTIAAGFVNLGLGMLAPTILSLALMVVIGVGQGAFYDLHAAITRSTEPAREALVPTLAGFVLALLSLPVFALIWGVRPQTLAEWWQAFLNGISIGDTTLSPGAFLTFAVVFVLGYMATRLVKGVLRVNVLPKTKLDSGGTNAILSGTGYVGVTLAALLAITTAGIDLSGLAIVAGALSVGIGFGLQTIVQNFVSGIILLIERPIKIGDWINVNGMEGFVRQISVRSTRIETFDKQDVIVPNADLISGVVTNYTLGNSTGRVLVPVGVAYGTDTRRVEAILREVTEAHPMVLLNPPPTITFEGFGADSLDFLIRAVLRDVLFKVIVKSEINHAIAERFRDEGIEIPFAQRDIWLRNPEVLPGARATAADQKAAPAPAPKDDDPETETP